MHLLVPTLGAFKALKADIVGLFPDYLRVKDSFLNEALARGLMRSGKPFHTYASLTAFFKSNATPDQTLTFDQVGFIARLMQLTDDPMAEAIGPLMDGAHIKIDIKKLSPDRQNAFRYSDVAYDISVAVDGVGQDLLETPQLFLLPDFGRDGSEPYRVDSAHSYRTDVPGFSATRNRFGEQVMTAKLVEGRWQGGLYIYSPAHIKDDSRCLKSVRMSLLRAIVPALASRIHCLIFRPDHYDYGAWRVHLRVGPRVKEFLKSQPLVFDLPMLPHRLLIPEPRSRVEPGTVKFEGDTWSADLYTNGIAEDDNPTTLMCVKAELLLSVQKQLTELGYFN